MKKFVFSFLLFVGLKSAFAQSIILNPRVVFSPYSAQAEVCNFTPRTVACNINLNAQTSYGGMLFGNLYNSPIFPGNCAYAYVTNYTAWPIINAWATSWCNFINY